VKIGSRRRADGETGRYGEILVRLNPADRVVIAYLAVIAALVLIFIHRIENWALLCAAHAVVIAIIVLIAKSDRRLAQSPHLPVELPSRALAPLPRRSFASLVHGWYPVALIGFTYKELTYLIPRIHPRDFDSALAAIDHRMLGVNPTVWFERLTWPPITEVLQLTYATYYFLPIILGVVLWRKYKLETFQFWVFVAVFGFYLSYLGYIAVPAIGPRFLPSITAAQTKPLTGIWLFRYVRETLDSAEGLTRDCFPSGHTEVTLLVLFYAHKFHRRTFWWLLPFGIGIIISTVYLRYHYVIDVVAGALLSIAIVMIATPLYKRLAGRPLDLN
jgi:membrane-associated phospholipid phosphatase